jgi:Derlin-2/3
MVIASISSGGTADYAFAMLFGAVLSLCSYPFLGSILPPVFCRNMIYFVMYIWSRRHPTSQANIWGVPMKAIYLPFAYLALTIFMGNPYFGQMHGMAMGHLYYFLADVVPQVYGKDFLQTPNFLVEYFGVGQYAPDPVVQEARNNPWNQARPGGADGAGRVGHAWGTGGRALGRD